MFCSHRTTRTEQLECWRVFKTAKELTDDLGNQVAALLKAIRLLPVEEPVRVEYKNGQLLMDGQPVSFSGPVTESACAQEWRELEILLAKEARL